MKFPSKITSYKESIISKLVLLARELQKSDMTLIALYNKTRHSFDDLTEYIDAVDCLFAINKIDYLSDKGVLHYVA